MTPVECIPFATAAEAHRALAGLANFIEDLPHDRFTMPRWSADDATDTSCGTAGCAAGWAATKFADRGWRLADGVVSFVTGLIPVWGGHRGHVAFAEFFRIPSRSLEITDPMRYRGEFGTISPTPAQTAKRIRDVLREIDPGALDEPMPCAVKEAACGR